MRKQYEGFKLIACFELHTYSSLDNKFIYNYRDSLSLSDFPIIFYDPEALRIKNRHPITEKEIKEAFNDQRIMIFTKPKALEDFLLIQDYDESILLMMSSGNYGGISWENLKEQFS